jgi:hypothetical protein
LEIMSINGLGISFWFSVVIIHIPGLFIHLVIENILTFKPGTRNTSDKYTGIILPRLFLK